MIVNDFTKAGFVLRKIVFILFLPSIIFFSNTVYGQNDFEVSKLILEPVLLSQIDAEDEGFLTLPGSELSTGNLIEQSLSRTLDISQYEQAVQDLESSSGPYVLGLAEQLGSLGRIYQETGDHNDAIELFERSKHIIRVNHGLFSLEQLTMQESIMTSYQALGDIKTVDEIREYIFYIKRKNYSQDSPEMIALNREWAEWNVESLLRLYNSPAAVRPLFNSGNENLRATDYILVQDNFRELYLPRNQLLNSSSSTMMISAVNMNMLIEPRLKEARELYLKMLEKAELEQLENNSTNVYNPEIHDLQRSLADISFVVRKKMEEMARYSGDNSVYSISSEDHVRSTRVVTRGYQVSRDAFEEIVESFKSTPDSTPIEIALALLDSADWDLVFNYEQRAIKKYEEAFLVLKGSGMSEQEIQAIFAPAVELPIPVYSVHQFSRQMQGLNRDSEVSYKGYIDIEYRLSRYGERRSVKVLKQSEGTPSRLRNIILEYLRTQRVRPIVKDGQVVKDTDAQFRYYYTY